MTTTLTEGRRTGEYLVSEANGYLSREKGVLLSGQNLRAGSVLGQALVGAAAAAVAGAGNAGNGVMGAVTVTGPAKQGIYVLTIIEPVTNLGNFTVEDPDGHQIGTGKVGTAFAAGGLAFTLADGTNDFAAGDTFAITVSGGTEKLKQWNPTNTDGSQTAMAILYANADATAGDIEVTYTARAAEVNGHCLEYFTGAVAADKASAAIQLAKKGIIVRN